MAEERARAEVSPPEDVVFRSDDEEQRETLETGYFDAADLEDWSMGSKVDGFPRPFADLAAEFPVYAGLEDDVRRYLDIVQHGMLRENIPVDEMPLADGRMVCGLVFGLFLILL
jgi:hypothetical protein